MIQNKVNCKSVVGEQLTADFKSGAIQFQADKGAFVKPATNQEWLLTNQDRLVRVDGNAKNSLSVYNAKTSQFVPTDALQDGESLDRTRALTKNDLIAKTTWKQWAGEGAWHVGHAAVVGTALGAIGGCAALAGQAAARRGLPSGSGTGVRPGSVVGLGAQPRPAAGGLAVAQAGLHAAGPFHPGDLNPPGHININPPPPAGLTPGDAAQEQMAQGAFAAAGGIIGGCIGGPVGMAIGGVLGAGVGALWNEAVR